MDFTNGYIYTEKYGQTSFINKNSIKFMHTRFYHECYNNCQVIGLKLNDEEDETAIYKSVEELINKLNNRKGKYLPKLEGVNIKINNVKQYLELLDCLDKNELQGYSILVEFVDPKISLEEIAKVASPKTIIISPSINYENITRVDKEYRKNLLYVASEIYNSNPDFLSYEELLDYVDQIAEEISKYAKNDKQKVLLLDKFFTKNFSYDTKFKKKDKNVERVLQNPARTIQGLVKNKKGVCAPVADLAAIILNHPKLNVKTNRQSGNDHAWNEIMIDEKYYSYDFTSNMTSRIYISLNCYSYINKGYEFIFDRVGSKVSRKIRDKSFEFARSKGAFGDVFVKKPSVVKERYGQYDPDTESYEELGFDKYSSMSAAEIIKEYEEIKDVDINPTVKPSKK